MSIELDCPQCHATLRVPDEAAGQQAKCPHCEAVFEVIVDVPNAPAGPPPASPSPASPSPASPPPVEPTSDPFAETTVPTSQTPPPQSPPPSLDSDNPYAAPAAGMQAPQRRFEEIQLGQLDAGKSMQLSWEIFRANLPIMLGANAIAMLVVSVLSGFGNGLEEVGQDGGATAVRIVGYAVQWFFGIGLALINLRIARAQPADIGLLFNGGPWFLRVALASILYYTAVGIGLVLFIVPGVYVASRFWAYQYFIVDRDCGVMESLNLSAEYTEGNKMQSVVLMLLTFVISLLGLLALCVGIFFAVPVVTMMWVVGYLMITRQPIQRPVSA